MKGSAPMMTADAFASIDSAWTLAFIFLRSRSTRERLPSASERLPPACDWIWMTMPKKLASVQRHGFGHAQGRIGDGQAHLLRIDDAAKLGPHRLRRFAGDQAHGVVQRQAGFDGAHDDVERVWKFVEERLDPAGATKRDEPARQAERAGQQRRPAERAAARRPQRQRIVNSEAAYGGVDIEALDGDLHAGLTELGFQRRFLDVLSLVFCFVVEFVQRILNRFAPLGGFRRRGRARP